MKRLISGFIIALFAFTLIAPVCSTVYANDGFESRDIYLLFWGAEQDTFDNTICYPKYTTSKVRLTVSSADYPAYAWVIGALEQTSTVFSDCSGGYDYYVSEGHDYYMENTVRQWNYTHAGVQMLTTTDEQAYCRGSIQTDTSY